MQDKREDDPNYVYGDLCPGGVGTENSPDRINLRSAICRIEVLGCYGPEHIDDLGHKSY
jgi:hypothetical protein